jgi:anti-sigma factor RsiW
VTMAEGHPYEHDLLAYVEDELAGDERDAVSRHLETCPDCAAQVADAATGRAVLHAAPPLELSPQRRAEILAGLRPPARRRPSWRLVLVAAAAVLVAVALAFAARDGGIGQGGDDQAGTSAALDSGAEEAGGADAPSIAGATLLAEVAGTPRSVAGDLRADGFDAVVEEGAVIVRIEAAQRRELERVVARFEFGPVAIYVR